MSIIRHNSIIVTGYDKNVNKTRTKAKEMGLLVSNIVKSHTNGYLSYFIAPDGSKEGWSTSNEFNDLREEFIKYLDGKHVNFVELISYDEDGQPKILNHG